MEPYEQHHITVNLDELVRNTIVNTSLLTHLLQAKVITKEEMAEMNNMNMSNPHQASLKFYWLLQTRKCYKILLCSLDHVRQSGAHEILNSVQEPKNNVSSTNPDDEEFEAVNNLYKGKMASILRKHKNVSSTSMQELHQNACKETASLFLDTKVLKPQKWHNIEEKLNKQFQSSGWHNQGKSPAIGIDLGTKNCVVGVFIDGIVKIVEFGSKRSFPSYVSLQADGSFVVGKQAKRTTYKNPDNTFYDSKRFIGRHFDDTNIGKDHKWSFQLSSFQNKPVYSSRGQVFSPVEISAVLLKHCKQHAEKLLGTQVTKAVITVPAYFNNHQREATIDAGEQAGLEVLDLLTEPLAAVIAYRRERIQTHPRKILVFDVGGGTFDVAVIELKESSVIVCSVGGDAYLGGEDIDETLVNYCIRQFKEQTGKDILDHKKNKHVARSIATLKRQCEQIKKELGEMPEAEITVDNIYKGEDLTVKLSRKVFEDLISPLLKRMMGIVKETLKKAKVGVEDIEDIALVGGTTYIPKLRQELQNIFKGKTLSSPVNVDIAVAYGAAVSAAILNSDFNKVFFNLQAVHDVIPMSIGIEAMSNVASGIFQKIIPSNSRYPCKHSKNYTTPFDNLDTITINIFQGESQIAKYNEKLGEFRLKGIPRKPKGQEPITVHMEINRFGILNVTATCSNGFESLEVINILKQSFSH